MYLVNHAVPSVACVVDDDMDLSVAELGCLLDELIDVGVAEHITWNRGCLAAGGVDRVCDLLRFLCSLLC